MSSTIEQMPHPNYYQIETPESLYNEIKLTEIAIEANALELKRLGQLVPVLQGRYEFSKNETLLRLAEEEQVREAQFRAEQEISPSKATFKHMTDTQRQARYRSEHAERREEWQQAEWEYKSCVSYADSMKGVLISKQSRLKLLDPESRWSGRMAA